VAQAPSPARSPAGAGKVALVARDAAKIKAWSATEAAWLDANGPGFCYANLSMTWDIAEST
jgi:hypothetical protein